MAPIEAAELDHDPPSHLLEVLAERTGTPRGRIRAMTLDGYVPLLIDALAPSPDLFSTYVCQVGCVLPLDGRRRELPSGGLPWVPWIAADLLEELPHCCRACLAGDAIPYVRIHWRAAWMASCPAHGVLLRPTAIGAWGFYPDRGGEPPLPSLVSLDHLTLTAVTTGAVMLPDGQILHAGLWLRQLRALLDEVTRPLHRLGRARAGVVAAWEQAGVPAGARMRFTRPLFEELPADRRTVLLAVAGAALQGALQDGLAPLARLCHATNQEKGLRSLDGVTGCVTS